MREKMEHFHPQIKVMDKEHTELSSAISLQFPSICLLFRRNPVLVITENQSGWLGTNTLVVGRYLV
jgi:hypothetical protein